MPKRANIGAYRIEMEGEGDSTTFYICKRDGRFRKSIGYEPQAGSWATSLGKFKREEAQKFLNKKLTKEN